VPEQERGSGKCRNNHAAVYGYPTRPEKPYAFCSQCGDPMAWECSKCHSPLPDEPDELSHARFCRDCGAPYFADDDARTTERATRS
jgi:hypothetical protein